VEILTKHHPNAGPEPRRCTKLIGSNYIMGASTCFLAKLILSTLKMEAICSSETPIETKRTTRRYIPEDGSLYNYRCENLKSYMYGPNFIKMMITNLQM
jgi:hypothetical protein